jgi:outer membrane protein OmpA-like peptidoglycan-associated protein
MRPFLAPAILAFASIFAGNVFAGSAYTAEDIVNHFAPQGSTRGICIGTETECGTADTDRTAAASYDLLITFDLDSANLTDAAKANLDEFAKALRDPRLSSATFEVDGHTDARGGDNYNMTLSERRAAAVVEYLTAQGVDATKLVAKGFGKSQPREADPFAAENRRVETRLVVQ